jgi:hypothetical protein
MDFPVDEILAALQVALQQVLPESLDDLTTTAFTLFPRSVKTSGIGGFIALNADPVGEVKGYQMEVEAQLRVSTTANALALGVAMSRIAAAFSGLSRRRRVELGLLRLTLGDIDPEIRQSGQGNSLRLEQTMICQVLYEFLKRPEDTEGIIQTVPLNVELSPQSSGRPSGRPIG